MKIILIHKDKLYNRPPVISVLMILLDLGYEVYLITTGISKELLLSLEGKKVQVNIIPSNGKNYFAKIIDYIRFRVKVFALIKKILPNSDDGLLWIEGVYTLVALGTKIKQYKYILQIQELHQNSKIQLWVVGKIIHFSKIVFMPEYNRTVLYKMWFNLKYMPVVLPNKPYLFPGEELLKIYESMYMDILEIFQNKKIILYQGIISEDRNLINYVKAIKELGGEYQFVIMGKNYGCLDKYKEVDPTLIHIDYVSAPNHLIFTSKAYIGIISYNPIDLNNIYCAPNKIYEYSKYNLPILGNNIPGLLYTIGAYKAGEIVNENNVDEIKKAILRIDENYKFYSANSRRLFDSVDNRKTIENHLKSIENIV